MTPSMSASAERHPRLTRMAPCLKSCAIPIASRTWDRPTLPEEQAEPEDTATPPRSSAIISRSALTPGMLNALVLGSRGRPAPKITASGASHSSAASNRSRSCAETRCTDFRQGGFRGGPEGRNGGHVLRTAPQAPLLSTAAHQRLELQILAQHDSGARSRQAAELVPRQKHDVGPESRRRRYVPRPGRRRTPARPHGHERCRPPLARAEARRFRCWRPGWRR